MTCSPAIAEETFRMTRITVACLDMAGTTVADDGTVMEAFTAAIAEQNLPVTAVQPGHEGRAVQHGPVQDRGVPAHPGRRGRRA